MLTLYYNEWYPGFLSGKMMLEDNSSADVQVLFDFLDNELDYAMPVSNTMAKPLTRHYTVQNYYCIHKVLFGAEHSEVAF